MQVSIISTAPLCSAPLLPRSSPRVPGHSNRYNPCHAGQFQFSSVAQSCPTLCDPMNCSTPGLPVHLTVAILIVNNEFCVFDLQFSSDEHFLTCLLAICMSSLEKCLFRSFAYFFSFIEVQLIYSVLTSVQNDSVMHTYIYTF